MVKSIKGKPLITQSYFEYNFRGLASMFRRGFFAIIVLLIVILIMLGLTYDAVGAEPISCEGEVTISAIECFTDARFFDDWKTVTTARISIDESKQFLNQHDLEVWSHGNRLLSMPASATAIDISDIEKPSFKLVDRLTLRRRTLTKNPCMSIASCSFMPPPDGTAWVWEDDAFQLRQVVVTGPPTKLLEELLDVQWSMKTFVLENWEEGQYR